MRPPVPINNSGGTGSTGPRRRQTVQPGARLAADAQNVGEAAIGDIGRSRALVLEHRVGRDRAAVHDRHLSRGDVAGQTEVSDPSSDRARRIIGRRQHLVNAQRTAVEQHEVGECASCVDAE